MYACHGKSIRLDKNCPVALRCMLLRVYVYPLLVYACDVLPVTSAYVKEANSIIYRFARTATGVSGNPDRLVVTRDCDLPDFEHWLDRARASYVATVRGRPADDLTRVALEYVEGCKRSEMYRLWLKPAKKIIANAGVSVDMNEFEAKRVIKEFLVNRHSPVCTALHAHASCGMVGLIGGKGYDISMARHCDAVRVVAGVDAGWAACHHTALPEKHQQALSALRYGTAPFARNMLHEVPISGRLCPFCAKGSQAFVEDEVHVCFDCPLYADARDTLVYELQGTTSSYHLIGARGCGSDAARVLGALLNPQCRASARAIAKFAFEVLRLRSVTYANIGSYRTPDFGNGWARQALVEWVGGPLPQPVSEDVCLQRLSAPVEQWAVVGTGPNAHIRPRRADDL